MKYLTVMSGTTTATIQTPGRYGSAIFADATDTSKLPDTIEVLRAGAWPETSNKGMLYISPDNLNNYVTNFDNGVGIPGGKEFGQLPIDFNHDDDDQAAGWITKLFVQENTLFANVTWTDAGAAALRGGMYKCFSPSFWPSCLGEWYDPENWNSTATDVLVGGALTNIPFFKDLTAIMASRAGNGKDKQLTANKAPKETTVPTLDEVRIKDVASLTDDDKKVLADNKSELSADELKKFSLDEAVATVVTADAKVEGISDEDKAILASVKSGSMKVVKADEWNGMQDAVAKLTADNQKHAEVEAQAFVAEHVERGAIKADQHDKWTKLVVANADMRDVLANLPSHAATTGEKGKEVVEASQTAATEVRTKANELIKASREAGTPIDVAKAYSQVMADNPELATRYNDEIKG